MKPIDARKGKTVAIIQARMGSTRFPGKVIELIQGKTMLWHVVNRVRQARLVDRVVVATSTLSIDDAIFNHCRENAVDCFRGSESDVLDRFYQAAKLYDAKIIIRITADCPLIDPQVVDKVVGVYIKEKYDFVANCLTYTYPDGLDLEVFPFSVLEKAWQESTLPTEREHVTPYIRNSGKFSLFNVESEINLSSQDLRWTVDDPVDLEFVRAIYDRLDGVGPFFGVMDVLKVLDKETCLSEINNSGIRNEGYYQSLVKEPALQPLPMTLRKSGEWAERAGRSVPFLFRDSQTASHVFINRGEGAHLFDVDGNDYIDCSMASGSVVLGYNHPQVQEAIVRQIKHGYCSSWPNTLEVEVAELLASVLPCAECVQLGDSHHVMMRSLINISKIYTSRDVVACCGGDACGYPHNNVVVFENNNLKSLEFVFAEHSNKVAAVVLCLEKMPDLQRNFLQEVRELTREKGSLLIIDEGVFGYRLALGGGQEYFGINADLSCYGSTLANGHPFAAAVGVRDVMKLLQGQLLFSSAASKAVSLAACYATTAEVRKKNSIFHFWEEGKKLMDGYNVFAREFDIERYTECVGFAPCNRIIFKNEGRKEALTLRNVLQQECFKRGVLLSGEQNVSLSHSQADIDRILRVYRSALEILAGVIHQ